MNNMYSKIFRLKHQQNPFAMLCTHTKAPENGTLNNVYSMLHRGRDYSMVYAALVYPQNENLESPRGITGYKGGNGVNI